MTGLTLITELNMNLTLLACLQAGMAVIAAPAAVAAGKAGIHPWLEPGERVEADVLVDGQFMARLEYAANAKSHGLPRQPALVFDLPLGLKKIRLHGQLTAPGGKPIRFDRSWQVYDMAHISAPLYDHRLRWLDRVRGLQATVAEFMFDEDASDAEDLWVEAYDEGGRATARQALEALEQRLGVPLPAPLWQLAEARIEFPDRWSFMPPARMRALAEVITEEWGQPRTGEDSLTAIVPPPVLARYERSVVVFVEMGDGMSVLAWDPAGDLGQDRPAAPGGVWFWMHQDEIARPVLLLDEDRQPRDAEAALSNVFQRFALDPDDQIGNGDVAVDTAHPRNLLQLHFNDSKDPHLWLRSYDERYSLY